MTLPPPERARLVLHAEPGPTIHPNLYGHFAEHLGRCIYEGLWVGDSNIDNVRGLRSDVIGALRSLGVPVLRWPGGCFADEYHWQDGIGPQEARPRRINTHWGGVIENNHFGTHEFMDLCEQIGAEPYVCGNVGSGSVREMREWVEYMTSNSDSTLARMRRANGREAPFVLPYFGVGNESWGCGGNMRPEYYADNYRRYSSFVRNHGAHRVKRIACGPNGGDYEWTEVLMSRASRHMDGLSLHYYTLPTGNWKLKGSATQFGEEEWHSTLKRTLVMERLIVEHTAIMDKYDPEAQVALVVDEWGTWYDVEPGHDPGFLYQQNSLRDALVAGINLNIFNQHARRVNMANIAQTVNVLQAVVLTDGPRMLLTPTYHVFEMYKVHQGASALACELVQPSYEFQGDSLPSLHASASTNGSGRVQLSLVHLHPRREITLTIHGLTGRVSGRVLSAPSMQAHNSFDDPEQVRPLEFLAFERVGEAVELRVPAKSVLVLEAQP